MKEITAFEEVPKGVGVWDEYDEPTLSFTDKRAVAALRIVFEKGLAQLIPTFKEDGTMDIVLRQYGMRTSPREKPMDEEEKEGWRAFFKKEQDE